MGINATLIGQMITFGLFVWVMMKFVWPPLTQAMQERQQRIAEGLAAAEQGNTQLERSRQEVESALQAARQQAAEILAQANRRGAEMIEQAKQAAREEGERQIRSAEALIAQEVSQARESLRREVADLAMAGAGRILKREIDPSAHRDLVDELVGQI
ncbi:MAG TPA: F0F1 ATP synthase subunit B [Candidatus Kapabacteria bacterium]|nr:F0F1 ATP synthase subunit B [Candidatus Kapabacteria bacterium]